MARNPYGVAHEVLAPAENALSGGIFRHFEPLVRSHDVGLPDGPQITLPRGMPLDVKELENEFDVTVDIPAVSKDDIQISVEHQMLTIKVTERILRPALHWMS